MWRCRHILVSKHVAEDLEEYEQWRPLLHDLGTCEVKHGVRVSIVNVCADQVGNPHLPKKFQALKKHRARLRWAAITAALLALAAIVAGIVVFFRYRVGSTMAAPEEASPFCRLKTAAERKPTPTLPTASRTSILTRLSKIADLKVISRTSTQHYKTAPENLADIREATWRCSHPRRKRAEERRYVVRVNVQLIRAARWFPSLGRYL